MNIIVVPFSSIPREGWTYANAITRMEDGATLISLRNFNLTSIVSADGSVMWEYDWTSVAGLQADPHDPELLDDGNILVALQNSSPYHVAELDRDTRELIWTYTRTDKSLRTTRDCNRLPNGNTLPALFILPPEVD